jgi:hypothetical protein
MHAEHISMSDNDIVYGDDQAFAYGLLSDIMGMHYVDRKP